MERHSYSVPHALAHQEVEVRTTADTVEVFCRGMRVASHVLSAESGKATTLTEHMPKSHQKYVGRTPSGLVEEAKQIGHFTGQLVEATLAAPHLGRQNQRSRCTHINPGDKIGSLAILAERI